MNTEELLKPRYKVIADYPNAGTANYVGKTYTLDSEDQKEYFDQYPHLFKPLQWWEERKESDMPGYVKEEDEVVRVHEFSIPSGTVTFYFNEPPKIFKNDGIGRKCLADCLPATEQEYLTQKQPQ